MTALPAANLAGPLLPLFYIAWLDFDGDPVRATTYPGGITFGASETGDPDLDGETFIHVPAAIVEIGSVTHQSGGSDQVTATLSGLPGPDDDFLDTIGTASNWQGRVARLWHGLHDGAGGSKVISPYYTGWMTQARLSGDPENGGRVTVVMENYLSLLAEPRNRSYQDQAVFDPDDKSAARIRAAANGVKGAGIGGGTASGTGGGARDVRQNEALR